MQIALHVAEWAVTAALAGLAGWLLAGLKRKSTHDKAMEQGMRVILRKQIVDAYDIYHNQGKHMTVERKREIDEAYEAYHALGGNGTITALYEDIDSNVWIERS